MTLTTDSAALAAFCSRQTEAESIAVDTEFLRESTYWPQLCLVQVAGPDEAVAIDTLADGLDLAPLFGLLTDPKILKVFHSARQDLEIFFNLMTARGLEPPLPSPIFDTQVAAMVCGFGDQVGYDTLVRKLARAKIDKTTRFADWSRRPLSKRQIDYALSDVIHLRPVYAKLCRQLDQNGRITWLEEEMAILTNPATYVTDPEKAWRRLKPRSGDRRFLAVLRELAAWREREAQRRDQPRSHVLRDDRLLDIAAQRPSSVEELARARGVSRNLAEGRIGAGILEAVSAALSQPESAWPQAPQRKDLPPSLGPLIDLLKVTLKARCQEHGVAPKLVASVGDLEQIASGAGEGIPALSGWRRKVFGETALALKEGQLSIAVENGGLRFLPVNVERQA